MPQQLPRRKQVVTQDRSKVIRETENPFGEEDGDDDDKPSPAGPSGGHSRTSSLSSPQAKQSHTVGGFPAAGYDQRKKKKEKKSKKIKPFNLEAEKEQMKSHIAEALIAATNLVNMLQTINRETERISENQIALQRFETCKQLRRKILRYIHLVESEQYLGSLLHANDELVTALMTFEQLDRSIDADSDSDDELAQQAHLYRSMHSTLTVQLLHQCPIHQNTPVKWLLTNPQWRQKKPRVKNRARPPAPSRGWPASASVRPSLPLARRRLPAHPQLPSPLCSLRVPARR